MKHQRAKHPIFVAVSGTGRLLSHLLTVESHHSYSVVGVVTSHPNCQAVTIADKKHIPVFSGDFPRVVNQPKTAATIQNIESSEIHGFYQRYQPVLTVLAGFIRPFPFDEEWPALNIHPSLLPKYSGVGFYGSKVHQAVIASDDVVSGASCHWVSEEYDQGEILSQVVVPRLFDDNEYTLAARVFKSEKKLLPTSIDLALKVVISKS
ncbi:MAG: formyltransferase family protein [Proteobacteria bacterium]|nr:formyltransferase family protein [Pseudomonadota bacterium]